MLKIKTHKDAFKAFLAPEKYGLDKWTCAFCEAPKHNCGKCVVEFYCDDGNEPDFPFVWPHIERPDRIKISRFVLRNCKTWRRENIERVARKKATALGYEFIKR